MAPSDSTASHTMLVTATRRGRISLFDPVSMAAAATIQARGRISRIRLRHGLLWVLGKHARWVEVYDVTDPSAPILLGSIS